LDFMRDVGWMDEKDDSMEMDEIEEEAEGKKKKWINKDFKDFDYSAHKKRSSKPLGKPNRKVKNKKNSTHLRHSFQVTTQNNIKGLLFL